MVEIDRDSIETGETCCGSDCVAEVIQHRAGLK